MTRRMLIAAALVAMAAGAGAQATARWVERTKADVRAGRGSYHEIVDTVLKGEQVQVVRGEARWLLVRTPRGKTGWVFETALAAQPVSPASSDFLRLAPGDASTSATAASTGAKGVYAQSYARDRGYDYTVVEWVEQHQPGAADVDAFVREGGLQAPGGGR